MRLSKPTSGPLSCRVSPGRPQGVKNNETNGLATGETDEIHDKYSIDAPAFDRQHGIDEIHQCCPSQPVFALLKVALHSILKPTANDALNC